MPLPKKSDSLMENTSDANKNNGPLLPVTITHCTDTWSLNGIHPTGLDMNTYNMRSRFMRKTHKKHKELPSSASSVMKRHKLKFTIVFQKLILLPWSEKVEKKKKKTSIPLLASLNKPNLSIQEFLFCTVVFGQEPDKIPLQV